MRVNYGMYKSIYMIYEIILQEHQASKSASFRQSSPGQKTELSGTVSAPHGTRHFVTKPGALQRTDSLATGRRRQSASARRQSIPILHSGAMFRNGIMQIMSQTLDPLDEQGNTDSSSFEFFRLLGGEERRKSTCSAKQMSTRNSVVLSVCSKKLDTLLN